MQTIRVKTLVIPEAEKLEKLLSYKRPTYKKHGIEPYSTYRSWTADFGNGYEIDIKVCSSEKNAPLWSEAVLFHNGSEISCTEPCDTLLGTWTFNHENTEYQIKVTEEKKK